MLVASAKVLPPGVSSAVARLQKRGRSAPAAAPDDVAATHHLAQLRARLGVQTKCASRPYSKGGGFERGKGGRSSDDAS